MVPTAWELTSPQKAVFPQVFKFIASSEGMAAATFPSLLPFLSKVPVDVMGGQEKFLDRWFSALEEAVGTVRGSLELKAVVVAYHRGALKHETQINYNWRERIRTLLFH